MLKEFMTRLRFLIRPRDRGEVDDELRFHFEQQIELNLSNGMSPEEARRSVR
jgi:macrolide transport system ATP-binding/permease protein